MRTRRSWRTIRLATLKVLWAAASFSWLTSGAPALGQDLPESVRLTGHGAALVTISSGGTATTDVRLDLNFRLTRERDGAFSGKFEADAAGAARAVVVIDGAAYALRGITADPPFAVSTSSRPITFAAAMATVAVETSAGRETTFEGRLTFQGDEGGVGVPLGFAVEIGERGEQGSIEGSGTWETPPGVKVLSGDLPSAADALLEGRYSGELHGGQSTTDADRGIVLVIELDGQGGVTGGRAAFSWSNLGVENIHPHPLSHYHLDPDGFGELVVHTGSEVLSFHIAVFDGGNGVKVGSQAFLDSATGELRRQ